MSNMLYACRYMFSYIYPNLLTILTNNSSILYKTKLPFILVFNKTDVQPHEFATEWMHDFEAFQRALSERGSQTSGARAGDGEPNYMDSLMNSMSLVLDEFYNHLTVGTTATKSDSFICSHWCFCDV